MSPHWKGVISVVRVLAYLLKDFDDNGMDLHFTISKTKYNSKKSSEFLHKLEVKTRKGTSDIGSSLSNILHDYQMYLREPPPSRRWSLFEKHKPRAKKALSLYVLTDAAWQPHSDADEPITSLVTALKGLGYPRKQVGIQFIHFGKDPEGIKKLEHLDNGLGLSMCVFL
jgi:hypothetical protein